MTFGEAIWSILRRIRFGSEALIADRTVIPMSPLLQIYSYLLSRPPLCKCPCVNYRFLNGLITRDLPSLGGHSFEGGLWGTHCRAAEEMNDRPCSTSRIAGIKSEVAHCLIT